MFLSDFLPFPLLIPPLPSHILPSPLSSFCQTRPAPDDNRCIIIIHGTDHHRNDPQSQALNLGNDLVNRGFSVLFFEFRARGESGGVRSSKGNREQWDVFGAIEYVESRCIPVERIGLLRFSLGAGVAILVAAQEPRIPAVVSDSGFLDYMT